MWEFSSVQFSHSVVSSSLQPHGPQHARPHCPSPTPRIYPNSWPLSWWCYPTISSSVIPICSCLQSFPASGSFHEHWTINKAEHWRIDVFELWCWRRLLRVPWTAKRSIQITLKEISPEYSLDGLDCIWNSSTLATWWEELTHWKRPWCWEGMRAGGEGDDRGWDGWMASPTQWPWVWVNSGSWWWIWRPSVLRFMGSKEWDTTEWLNWTEDMWIPVLLCH